MKIVIDIPEKTYEQLKFLNEQGFGTAIDEAVANGTPLPKGHGRLIDADALDKDCESSEYHEVITSWLDLAPTIIEADCTYRETGCGSCKNQLNCPYDKESD